MNDIELSHSQARDLTDRIKVGVEAIWELIKQAYQSRAWAALGYDSWDDYCTREFGTSRIRLPREERQEVVASMREIGMSTRAIGTAIGASEATVRRELAGASNDAPVSAPQPVVGTDGKTYAPRPTPRPEPEPESDPDDEGGTSTPSWEPAGHLHPADLAALNGEKKSIFLPKPTPEPRPYDDVDPEDLERRSKAKSSYIPTPEELAKPTGGKKMADTMTIYESARKASQGLTEMLDSLMETTDVRNLDDIIDKLQEQIDALRAMNSRGDIDQGIKNLMEGTN